MWDLTPNCLNEECDSVGNWKQYLGTVIVDPAGQFYFPKNGVLSCFTTSTPPLSIDPDAIPDTNFSIQTELSFSNLSAYGGSEYYDLRIYTTTGAKIRFLFYSDGMYISLPYTAYSKISSSISESSTVYQFDVSVNEINGTATVDCYQGSTYLGRATGKYETISLKGYAFGVYASAETCSARMNYLKIGRIEGSILPIITSDAVIDVEPWVSGTINLPLLTIENEMFDNRMLEMPMLDFDTSAIIGKMVSGSPSLPLIDTSFDLRAYDLQTSLSLPLLSIKSTITYYDRYANVAGVMPAITGYAYGGGQAALVLPAIKSVSTGKVSRFGTVTITLPAMKAVVTGLVSEIGTTAIILPAITGSILGHSNPLATVALILPVLDIVSTGLTGEIISGGFSLPKIKASSTAWWNSGTTVSILIPSIRLSSNAIILTTDYEVLVLNVKNNALTNYVSYAYNSLCVFNGKNIGAKSSGIYELSGETDNGSAISWKIRTGKIDSQVNDKHAPKKRYAVLSYHPSGDLTLTVIGEEEEYDYDVESYTDTDNSSRVKFGKGIRDKYLQFELKNKNGESIFLDKMKIFSDKERQR